MNNEQIRAVMLSSNSVEWYTPRYILDAVRATLHGQIDLDPCSTEGANTHVRAKEIYTIADNGLVKQWGSKEAPVSVWLNPPYGKIQNQSSQEIWLKKLIYNYEHKRVSEAVAIVNVVPAYKWWSICWNYPLCFINHCIEFIPADGQVAGKAKASSALIYLGGNLLLFEKSVKHLGHVIYPRTKESEYM